MRLVMLLLFLLFFFFSVDAEQGPQDKQATQFFVYDAVLIRIFRR